MARLQVVRPVALRQVIDVGGELVLTGDYEVPSPAQTYPEDHPLVRAYPWAFASPEAVADRREQDQRAVFASVEQATAAPGEKRTTRRRKTAEEPAAVDSWTQGTGEQ